MAQWTFVQWTARLNHESKTSAEYPNRLAQSLREVAMYLRTEWDNPDTDGWIALLRAYESALKKTGRAS